MATAEATAPSQVKLNIKIHTRKIVGEEEEVNKMHNKNITTPKKCKTCEGSKD
jgi:hypothetical protein